MTLERWKTLSKHDQLLSVGAEIMRAKTWQGKDDQKFCGALERAIVLVDLTQEDEKWVSFHPALQGLRRELAAFLERRRTDDVSVLSRAL